MGVMMGYDWWTDINTERLSEYSVVPISVFSDFRHMWE